MSLNLSGSERQYLDDVYRRTSFQVFEAGETIEIRIGEPNVALDKFLAWQGITEWAFVTAFNPESKRLSDEENERRHHALREWLTANNYRALPGQGVGQDKNWRPEPSFMILGITREKALELGRLFQQNAIVTGQFGSHPKLVWYWEST